MGEDAASDLRFGRAMVGWLSEWWSEWWYLIRRYWVGILLGIGAVILLNLIFDTSCTLKLVLGLPCPACGMTRAAFLLLRGDFQGAFFMHPLIYAIVFEIILIPFLLKTKNSSKCMRVNVIIFLLVTFAVYIYRFASMFPQTEPMSYYSNNVMQILLSGLP
ncbi:MAG: DUF2752 domain-containing protein [Lachnospiraceae bacterium]